MVKSIDDFHNQAFVREKYFSENKVFLQTRVEKEKFKRADILVI